MKILRVSHIVSGIVTCLVLSTTNTAFAQRVNIDSVVQLVANAKDDDQKLAYTVNLYSTSINNDPEYTIEIGLKLLKQAQQDGNVLEKSTAYSFLGHGYRLAGNHVKGLQYHHEAIRLAEENGNPSLLCIANNQLAHIYKDRSEFEKAIRIYKLSAEDGAKGRIEKVKYWPLVNLGAVYLLKNQPDSAVIFTKPVYEKFKDSGDQNIKSLSFITLGGAYSKLNQPDLSTYYFQKALSEHSTQNSKRYLNMVYVGLAEHYQLLNKPDSVEFYARNAIDAVTNTPFFYLSSAPANMLSSLYDPANCDSTLKYARMYKSANDSLYNTRANQQIQMMTFDEDIRQYQLNEEKEKFVSRVKQYVTLAGLITAIIVAMILFRNNKLRKKANNHLSATLRDLKSTQAQLIQSEKMASLGELTAGIAHEIQNPLNFVNNFSEISSELIEEAEEAIGRGFSAGQPGQEAGKKSPLVAELLQDIKQNLVKINHHGKRADAIVKGMLQHSQSRSGTKEPTDINALVDEYLRLAYISYQSKYPDFEAKMETSFDASAGEINIIPQDIGKALLNLYSNAFYACNHRDVNPGDAMHDASRINTSVTTINTTMIENIISVSTKRMADKIEITVTDNGGGIDPKIIDKIFQPFFTTKPTGQGTGLGLSLAYDIIKAYGGKIEVESKQGEGTVFTLVLPV